MATWPGTNIWYTEYVGKSEEGQSPEITLGPDGSSVVRVVDCHWADHLKLARAILGAPAVATQLISGEKYVARKPPHAYPDAPWMFATRVQRIRGVGPRGNEAALQDKPPVGATDPAIQNPGVTPLYEHARLWIEYNSVQYGVMDDMTLQALGQSTFPDEGTLFRFVARGWRPAGGLYTLPRGIQRFKNTLVTPIYDPPGGGPAAKQTNDDTLIPEGLGLVEPGATLVYTWVQTPVIPKVAILQAMGCANQFEFDGYPAHTLLCAVPDVTPMQYLDQILYTIQYRFEFLPRYGVKDNDDGVTVGQTPAAYGHNFFRRWNAAKRDMVLSEVCCQGTASHPPWNGSDPYHLFDFAKLFRPDQ